MRAKSSLVMLLAAGIISCSNPASTEPEWQRQPGLIMMSVDGKPVPYTDLALPDTVDVGESFDVRFATWAPTSCEKQDEVVITQAALLATITPYDIVPPPDVMCFMQPQHFDRTATLRFNTPGKATIQLRGNIMVDGKLAVIERSVIVR